ncbi:MAG: DUF2299 domain-containing protein [Crenarchaeota archaeon]|nr:DUF2299 domain-containing protein [Thermoproteota archaeon]
MKGEDIKRKILEWLVDAGLTVQPSPQPPPNADWALTATTPPPLRVNLTLLGRGDIVAAGIGVRFSPPHMEALRGLDAEERVRFSAELMRSVAQLCPPCRIALQGPLHEPQGLAAEVVYTAESLDRQKLLEEVARLVNVYLVVNSLLWERFPSLHIPREGGSATTFM